jgi:hypothetical protein
MPRRRRLHRVAMVTSVSPGRCPFCGATNPSWYTSCQRCHKALPAPGAVARPSPPTSTDPLAPRAGGQFVPIGPLGAMLGGAGIVWFSLGIASVVVGIFLLVAGSLVALIGGFTGQTCAMNPFCLFSTALHVFFVISGLLLVLAGIALMAFGFHRNVNRPSGMTLPP